MINILFIQVKTQQVTKSRGQRCGDMRCGDIELTGRLVNVMGPIPLVVDLRNTHERWASTDK
jgi:hypothetical protein